VDACRFRDRSNLRHECAAGFSLEFLASEWILE
jgi:hypothetical protein